jgi:hypothetical protein
VIKTAILKLAGAIAEAGEGAGLPSTAAPSTAAPTHLPRGVWERLRACLDHELTEMRLLAAESLCVIDASRGREALVERARIERDPDVLAAIDAALSAARRQKKGAGAP